MSPDSIVMTSAHHCRLLYEVRVKITQYLKLSYQQIISYLLAFSLNQKFLGLFQSKISSYCLGLIVNFRWANLKSFDFKQPRYFLKQQM